jgi:hypothetical protein
MGFADICVEIWAVAAKRVIKLLIRILRHCKPSIMYIPSFPMISDNNMADLRNFEAGRNYRILIHGTLTIYGNTYLLNGAESSLRN